MSDRTYNWRRFWCPRSGKLNLGDGGYLIEPDNEVGRYANPDVREYSSIAVIPCLALLGEPGTGKTYALKAAAEWAQQGGGIHFRVDLREFGSESRLVDNIFCSTIFRDWLASDQVLEMMLDSLDECLLRINTIASILVEQLRHVPINRLHLRIACRTAEWPTTLEAELKKLWGEKQFEAFELAPLCRRDVRNAAEIEQLDAGRFLAEIERVRAEPLAIKPVTLRLLLKSYRQYNGLPLTEAELYTRGCLLLCEETQERREARVPLTLDASQRLAVSKRIAAITIFSNKFAIWTGLDEGDVPVEDVLITKISFGSEQSDGHVFEVNRLVVEETLRTGLFTSRGPHRLGWAHQTYAEFLASLYLQEHHVTTQQILSLITDEISGQLRVVPQLGEVAARIATYEQTIFDTLLQCEPTILLRSDVSTADEQQKKKLILALLERCSRGEFYLRWSDYYNRLRHLKHADLAAQLRPYLVSTTINSQTKELALDIAQCCSVAGLNSEIVSIALDRSQNTDLRVGAVDALAELADAEVKSRLTEIANASPEDSSNRIRGAVLRILWPDFITAEQVFSQISIQETEREINRYTMFVAHEMAKHFRPEHMPAALRWVINQTWSRYHSDHVYVSLLDSILVAAWKYIDAVEVLPLLAQAIRNRLTLDHGHLIDPCNVEGEPFLDDLQKRHRLLQAICTLEQPSDFVIYCHYSGLVRSEDFQWLLDQLSVANTSWSIEVWKTLSQRCYNVNELAHTELIFEHAKTNTQIRSAFSWLFEVTTLDSPAAIEAREDARRMQAMLPRRSAGSITTIAPAQRVQSMLLRCENGRADLWWRLAQELTLKPDSTYYDDMEPDIINAPGWRETDEQTRNRILAAAKEYILHSDDKHNEWPDDPLYFFLPANAGYLALRLLFNLDKRFIENLPVEVWGHWSFALMKYPVNLSGEEADKHHSALLKLAYHSSADLVCEAIRIIIRREALGSPGLFSLNRIKPILDQNVRNILHAIATDLGVPIKSRANILIFLIEQNDQAAQAIGFASVSRPLASREDERNFTIALGAALGAVVTQGQWQFLWQAIQDQPDLGRSLIGRWASSYRHTSLLTNLSDDQLAALYIWVANQYPHTEDPQPVGVHTVDDREQIAFWRDQGLLHMITQRGTLSACSALQSIKSALPQLTWLNYVIQNAMTLARANNWWPLDPAELLTLVYGSETRKVDSGIQLLNVIEESLSRLEGELHGANPTIRQVWDYQRKSDVFTPIDENPFSDYIASYLRRDVQARGIVINREVEIRPSGQGQPGQATDIHIVALRTSPGGVVDTITCIVETKGCWNRDLKTAMYTQLAQRYLRDNQCSFGLYLVGWFMCDMWDESDVRKKAVPNITIHKAREYFNRQATRFSRNGRHIRAHVLDARLVR